MEAEMNNLIGKESLPFVSVIIPTYHDWVRLQLCLNALEAQTYPQEYFEILVVNNDPEDLAPESLVLPKNCTLLEEAKPGSYAARNKALSIAKGEIYAFTDSDCQPKEDWLDVSVVFLRENPEYDRVGGNIKLFSKNKRPNWYEIYEFIFAFPQKAFVLESGMAATGNMISRKKVFNETGYFDDRLMSGGDGEWGKRADKKGFKIKYLNDCIVYHPTRRSSQEILIKNRRLVGGHLALAKQRGSIAVIKLLIKGFMPPINAAKRAISQSEAKFTHKFIAILMSYYLKLFATIELLRIVVTNKASERL